MHLKMANAEDMAMRNGVGCDLHSRYTILELEEGVTVEVGYRDAPAYYIMIIKPYSETRYKIVYKNLQYEVIPYEPLCPSVCLFV